MRGGKAFAAEQKIKGFKKFLFRRKCLNKACTTKRLDVKKLIKKVPEKINYIRSQNYGFTLEGVEEKAVVSENFRDIYDF